MSGLVVRLTTKTIPIGYTKKKKKKKAKKKASQLLRSQKKTIQKQKTLTFHQGKRNTLTLSRYYRAFLYTKQLCDALGIKFLDIYHPLSGPGFDAIRIEGDVHKKRYAWRMKASLLLNGLIEIGKKNEDSNKREMESSE